MIAVLALISATLGCPKTVELRGDPDAVAVVRGALHTLAADAGTPASAERASVAPAAPARDSAAPSADARAPGSARPAVSAAPARGANCGVLIATVTSSTGKQGPFTLSLSRDGRQVRRLARSPEFAAAIIDAWRVSSPRPLLRLARPPPAPRTARSPAAAPEVPAEPDGLIEGFGTIALADDATWWGGGGIRARLRAAGWAPYVALWTAHGRHRHQLSAADRWTATALVGVGLTVEGKDWTLRPGLGAGIGVYHTRRVTDECRPTCPQPGQIDDGFVATIWGPRIELVVAGDYRGWRPFVLAVEVGIETAPLSTSDLRIPAYAESWTDAQQRQVALPGEPLLFGHARLAIGWTL